MYFHTYIHNIEDYNVDLDDAVKAYVRNRCPDTVRGVQEALSNLKTAIAGLEEWLEEHQSE